MPQVLSVVQRYHTFAVVEHNKAEAQSLIDSGMLKAMFSILGDYWVANADNIQAQQQEQIEAQLEIVRMLLEIMSVPESKDYLAQLYSFRLIAILCRINPLIGQKFGSGIIDVLYRELIPSAVKAEPGEHGLKGGLSTFEAL